MNELALFAGAGGGLIASRELGWRTVCAVEIDEYAASILCGRQNEGLLPPFPIWSDVRSFDGRPWRGIIDVVSGGFPCQDISAAGSKQGIDGEKSGLWREMARVVREVRPRFVWVENSSNLATRGIGRVLGDLASLGYDARWGVLGASAVGAPHKRERMWIRAENPDADLFGCRQVLERFSGEICSTRPAEDLPQRELPAMADANGPDGVSGAEQLRGRIQPGAQASQRGGLADAYFAGLEKRESERGDKGEELKAVVRGDWWAVEPGMGRVVNGLAGRVDRIKALGNGQVPACSVAAWRMLGG